MFVDQQPVYPIAGDSIFVFEATFGNHEFRSVEVVTKEEHGAFDRVVTRLPQLRVDLRQNDSDTNEEVAEALTGVYTIPENVLAAKRALELGLCKSYGIACRVAEQDNGSSDEETEPDER